MAEKVTKIETESINETTGEEPLVVSFSKTYDFEGKKITEVDLSGLEDVTAATMIKANRVLVASGDVQIMPENSLHYALIIAAECTEYPIEFYKMLNPVDALRVKNAVNAFFLGGVSD